MTEHVALLHAGRAVVDAAGALPELPPPAAGVEERQLSEVLALVRAEIPVAPTARLADGRLVHFVGMRTGEPAGSLAEPGALRDDELAQAVARAVLELDPAHTPVERPDWFRHGWHEAIEAWIDTALLPSGRRRTGPIEPVKAWSVSAVARVPIEGGAVWVKQPCAHFEAEARIHHAVAALLPELVPQLIATDVGRGWLLMEPMTGVEQAQHADGAALQVAERWADAQIAAAERVPTLLEAGLPHRGIAATLSAFRQLLEHSAELALLSAVELAEIRGGAERIEELVRELWAAGIPETLAHGDLHLDNVAWDGESLRLFDWTDGCVSHPFLDIVHLTRFMGVDGEAATVESAYARRWRAAHPDADIDRALVLAPLVDLVFQVVTFDEIAKATEPVSAWELGGVVAKKLRQLSAMLASHA